MCNNFMHAYKLGCNRKQTEEIEHQAGKLASSSFLATAWVGCLKSCEFFVLGPAHYCLQHFDTTVNTLANKGICIFANAHCGGGHGKDNRGRTVPGKRGKRLTISKKTQPTPHMSIL